MYSGMDFERAFDNLGEKAKAKAPFSSEDYEKGGLIYCHKCHTPKEIIVETPWGKRKERGMCKCESDNYDAEEERRKAQERIERLERRRKMGFSDEGMRKWRFENDDGSNKEMAEIAHNFVKNFKYFLHGFDDMEGGKGLLLYGPVGTGKTFYAACIVNELIERGYPCMMTSISRVAYDLQADFESRQEKLDSLNQFDLLVLDDLAAERKTEYMNEIVNTIIDARCRSGKPLIITTNLTGEELNSPDNIWNQRVYSRLMKMCLPCAVVGKDRRREQLKSEHSKWRKLLESGQEEG